ncbi:hypothetical protein Glove_180g125 [Diversispora epigaea]|uniref:Proteasome assembly chaperone 1 n=1 Tax=Diversispora epigaea TaxID=1348612 RepID=A0A397IRH4_9GLOM|nr:hypothetical protein Glove_180g125 [Diversispora epigaea]
MEFDRIQPVRFAYDDDEDSEYEEELVESLKGKPSIPLELPLLHISSTYKNNKKISIENKLKFDILLIGVYGGGNIFLDLIVNNKKIVIGSILLPEIKLTQNTLDQEIYPNQGCFIYHLESDPNIAIIPCNYNINDDRCFLWVKALFDQIKAERVYIFDTFKISSYLTNVKHKEFYPPLYRLLKTSVAPKLDDSIQLYESPNLMFNLSAALLSHCEIRRIPAYLILSLQDTFYGKNETTVQTLKGFQECLKILKLNNNENLQFNFNNFQKKSSNYQGLYV